MKREQERNKQQRVALIVDAQRIKLRSQVRALHALSRGTADSLAISHMLRQSGVDAGRWLRDD